MKAVRLHEYSQRPPPERGPEYPTRRSLASSHRQTRSTRQKCAFGSCQIMDRYASEGHYRLAR